MKPGRAGILPLLLGALALAALTGTEFFLVERLRDMRGLVEHTHEVLREASAFRLAVLQAELRHVQAGAQPSATASEAAANVRDHLAALETLTRDNPSQQVRLRLIRPALEATLASWSARQPPAEGARRALDVQVESMVTEELRLLDVRQEERSAQSDRARLAELAAALAALGLVTIAIGRLRREIKQREATAAALSKNEQHLATTLDSIGDGVIVTDERGLVKRLNPISVALTGFSQKEAEGRAFAQVFHIVNEKTRAPAVDPVARVMREGVVVGLANHTVLISKDGTERAIADSAAPIRDVDGNVTGVVMVFRDMSEDRAAEIRLHDARAFLDSVIENVPHMIFVKDADELRFVRMNRAGERLLGVKRQELLGKNDFDFFPDEQARFFQGKDRDVLAGGTLLDIPEEPIQTPSGERWLHTQKIPILGDDGEPRFLLGISQDITERRRLGQELDKARGELERRVEERTRELAQANAEMKAQIRERELAEAALEKTAQQLRQSQKMEAIGRLAGGIAHDFNNILSVILSYSEIVKESLGGEHPLTPEIDQVSRAAYRAADLTRQLLAFSRQQVLVAKVVDLNDSIDAMDKMLRRVIGEDINLRTLPGRGLARIRVDPAQMEQVILNLAVNARDAMPRGGTLTIETSNVTFDAGYASGHEGVSPGDYVMLAVTDTGSGMDRDVQGRIFEPFFTTKGPGKGTGLGLSTVLGIVEQSGGKIWVYSEPGRGTTFKVYLPRAPNVDPPARPRASVSNLRAPTFETILLVEDDEQVRKLAEQILVRNGFRVLSARDGEEALRVAAAHTGSLDLLVTDVVMPRMGGRELVEELALKQPGLPALYMSGYTDDTIVHHGVLDAQVPFLQKPITPDTLLRKVREILDSREPAPVLTGPA